MKNIKRLAIIAFSLGAFTACDLEVTPPADMAAENFWKTEKDAWYGLNSCYATMEGMDIWDEMCTDNAHSHKPWEGNFELVQQNGINASDNYGDYSFGAIRTANNFIAEVDKCDISDNMKSRMKAEARFFRALSYLNLTTKFGKVAIVTTVLPYDAPNVERNSVAEVQKFILDELKEIADVLPEKYSGGYMNEAGRITKGGALALRARAALYFGNYAEAEASASAVMTSGKYSLFRISELNDAQKKEASEMDAYIDYAAKGIDKDKFVKGMFSYESLWFTGNAGPENPEYVITREYMAEANNYDWSRYTYMIPQSLSITDGYSSFEPMQDLIDAYWDVDGKTMRNDITMEQRKQRYEEIWNAFKDKSQAEYINDVPTSNYMDFDYMKEFRNRDSRLYASMLFPFKGWHETDYGTFYYRWDPALINKNGNESWTGYSYRKMVALSPYDEWASDADFPVIRYAEVLLTFAEAHAQTTGWDDKVTAALNDLRDRCGMPDVPQSMSKEAGIEFIRNERRIELAAEGHRYDDIRRYGNEYAKKAMTGPSYAPNGYAVITKEWNERLMLMPIPQSAIDLNPILKGDQNSGY